MLFEFLLEWVSTQIFDGAVNRVPQFRARKSDVKQSVVGANWRQYQWVFRSNTCIVIVPVTDIHKEIIKICGKSVQVVMMHELSSKKNNNIVELENIIENIYIK